MPNKHTILVSAKCLGSTPCTVCFLLPTCSTCLMECTVLVIVVLLLLYYPPYCVVVVCASHPGFLSIISARICRIVSSHVSLYARVILFFVSSPYALVSISLRSSVSFRDESHPKLHLTPPPRPTPPPLVLGRFTCVFLSRLVRSRLPIRSIPIRRSSKILEISM